MKFFVIFNDFSLTASIKTKFNITPEEIFMESSANTFRDSLANKFAKITTVVNSPKRVMLVIFTVNSSKRVMVIL